MPKYSPEITEEICTRIAEGEPLRAICRDLHMPSWQAVYQWLEKDEDFARRFARARELGFDAIAEEALEIANTPEMGVEIEETVGGKEGDKRTTKKADMLGHRKLQVHTRLQLLAKWCPEKYGEKRTVDLTVNEPLADRLARAKSKADA